MGWYPRVAKQPASGSQFTVSNIMHICICGGLGQTIIVVELSEQTLSVNEIGRLYGFCPRLSSFGRHDDYIVNAFSYCVRVNTRRLRCRLICSALPGSGHNGKLHPGSYITAELLFQAFASDK